jgi:hypothetical protein
MPEQRCSPLMGPLGKIQAAAHREGMERLCAEAVVPIRDLSDGAVARVTGRIEHVRPALVAPLSGRSCACFHLLVEQVGPPGALVPSWSTVVDAMTPAEFLIRDATGAVLVRPTASTLLLVKDYHELSSPRDEPSAALKEFLARHGRSDAVVSDSWTRILEGVLEAGERVAVLGRVRMEPDPDVRAIGGSYRARAMRTVLAEPGASEPMLISDDPQAID